MELLDDCCGHHNTSNTNTQPRRRHAACKGPEPKPLTAPNACDRWWCTLQPSASDGCERREHSYVQMTTIPMTGHLMQRKRSCKSASYVCVGVDVGVCSS